MEVIRKYSLQMVEESSYQNIYNRKIKCDNDVYEFLKETYKLHLQDREHFVVIALDAKGNVIGLHTASIGTLSAAIVEPREVMKFAILANAHSIIISHNHPSGDLSPSVEDTKVTERIEAVCDIMGIPLLDHIIVSRDNYYSFQRNRSNK